MTTPITRDGLNAVRTKPLDAQIKYLKEGGLDDGSIAALTKDGKLDKQDTAFMSKRISEAGNKAKPAEVSLLNGLKALDAQDSLDASKPKTTKYPDVGPLSDVAAGKVALKKGSGGPAVVEAQKMLEQAGFKEEKYGADGKFGPRTKAKVEEFQKANSLPVTGEIDAATLKKLQEVTKAKTEPKTETKTETKTEPVKPSLVTSTALGNMKLRTTTKDAWDGNAKSVSADVMPKLDPQGQKDLQGALNAAREGRFNISIADKMKSKEQFDSYMKQLDGKLDPALAKALRELF